MKETNKSEYKHQIGEKIKFHEVDMLEVCNNAVYFTYFEDARLAYLQNLMKLYNLEELMSDNKFFIMAHNNCDYYKPGLLDDELTIHTKIEFVKNSSFGFRHLVERNSDGEIIASGGGVMVYILKDSKMPFPLPKGFVEAVRDFEEDCNFLK